MLRRDGAQSVSCVPQPGRDGEIMDGTAGFGSPPWLPLSVRRAQAAEERAEAQQARAAQRVLASVSRRGGRLTLTMLAAEADARGEYIDPVALATGRVTGHSLADVLETARMASEWQDARAETCRSGASAGSGSSSSASSKTRPLAACPR